MTMTIAFITKCVSDFLCRHVNDSIMELLITCYACKSASCKRVIGVIPYMPYSRHSESDPPLDPNFSLPGMSTTESWNC